MVLGPVADAPAAACGYRRVGEGSARRGCAARTRARRGRAPATGTGPGPLPGQPGGTRGHQAAVRAGRAAGDRAVGAVAVRCALCGARRAGRGGLVRRVHHRRHLGQAGEGDRAAAAPARHARRAAVRRDAAAGGFTARDEQLLCLFAGHAAIALINARLYERVGELSVLEERGRLARELHDAVSQKLFSIRAKARAASVLAGRDPARAAPEMDSVAALSGEAHAELRAVISGLAPPELGERGLAESLRRYAALAGRAHGVTVRFCAEDIPALGAGRDAAAYRVAQEALHNALRHSGAREIEITLRRTHKRVLLAVSDDGHGFSPDAPAPGMGLASMRERAAAAGATLSVSSAPGSGTTVTLSVPAGPAARP